jgi:hypothetical protein
MSYATQAQLAVDPAFRGTVKIALVTAARALLAQQQGATELSSAVQKRKAVAMDILRDPDLMLDTAVWALASVPAITATTPDAAILSAVNLVLAGLIS